MNTKLGALLRILALTRKELLAVLKDRRSRLSLLIPPVVQAFIFGYAATYDVNHVTYAALDQDHTAASRQLLAGLDGIRDRAIFLIACFWALRPSELFGLTLGNAMPAMCSLS